jgi:hypothetical protein
MKISPERRHATMAAGYAMAGRLYDRGQDANGDFIALLITAAIVLFDLTDHEARAACRMATWRARMMVKAAHFERAFLAMPAASEARN